ncbi:Kinesin-like protein KIN-14I [Linum perenne]
MATEEAAPSLSLVSVVEDVLQHHGIRRTDIVSKKIDEASAKRYEAADWLRKTVGVGGGSKDLPSQPSEEEFRNGLRSGIILCNAVNKVQPGRIAKVVEGPGDSFTTPDVAPLSAFQYFENMRNFLVAAEEMGLPAFENSDLEQGGKSARVVSCVLALKSYYEWKQSGGTGQWKYGGTPKPGASPFGKFTRKTAEPFVNSSSQCASSPGGTDSGNDNTEAAEPRSLNTLVQAALSHRNQEEVPNIVESMLSKVMEEYERRLASRSEVVKTTEKEVTVSNLESSPLQTPNDTKIEEDQDSPHMNREESLDREGGLREVSFPERENLNEESKRQRVKQKMFVEQQQMNIQELRRNLHDTRRGMQFFQAKYLEEFNSLGMHLYSLAHAASGYKRVLQENRKLYNQVQDLKGNIRVYCRVRPFLPGQASRFNTVDHIEEGNITIATPSKYGKEGRKIFNFNKVFGPMATQAEVFADTEPLIRSVLDGYNVCIFAYGQTGSGKTFTMTGPKELTEESLGVNYRALSDLFLISEQRKDVISYEISCQMLEIYNEQVRDLLTSDALNKRLEIRNSSNNGINVPDASLVPVSSPSDVINLMNTGHKNRAVSATAMNDRSSRSHSCLTVHIQGKDLTSGSIIRGSMHLVDLAGSERVDKSEVTGDRLKEAQHINKSLSALGDVIASLAVKSTHVPYRNSKLTQLLQDSLGGQAKTLMFVHISPEAEAVGETLSTLKFAERVATVELGAAKVNKDSTEVKDLKDQISSLKAALARKEEMDQSQHSGSSTPERYGLRTGGASPPQHSWHGGMSNAHLQSDEANNIKGSKNSLFMQRRRSLDPHYLRAEDEKESLSLSYPGEWVDKAVLNKEPTIDELEVMETAHPSHPARIYPEQQSFHKPAELYRKETTTNQDLDVMSLRSRCEAMSTDGSDDLDAGTSDSSDVELTWQSNSNLPRMTTSSSLPSLSGSKLKKPSPRTTVKPATETR